MKNYRIVYIKGEPRVVEWPEEPKYNTSIATVNQELREKHYKEIKAAIANGVPPADN